MYLCNGSITEDDKSKSTEKFSQKLPRQAATKM
jgi:hypothetical protein